MVNTYTSMKNERMMLYLDIEDRGILKKEHLKEESLSIAATLYQRLLKKGTEVGICINLYDEAKQSIFYLSPSRRMSEWMELEKTLAEEWQEDRIADFEKVLEVPFEDAIPVLITKNISDKRVQKIEEFVGKRKKGILVVPYEKGGEPKIHSDRVFVVGREVER